MSVEHSLNQTQLKLIQQAERVALTLDAAIQKGEMSDDDTDKAQVRINEIVELLKDQEELLGKKYYILYEAQALISWINDDKIEAKKLLEIATDIYGGCNLYTKSARELLAVFNIKNDDREDDEVTINDISSIVPYLNGATLESAKIGGTKENIKVASVPYAVGKSFDFYNDKIVFESKEIPYDILDGYSYLLTHESSSINLIPTSNSTCLDVYFSIGDRNPIKFERSAASPFAFNSEKQDTVRQIFVELVKCIEVIVAPYVFFVLWNRLLHDEEIMIGELIISNRLVKKKSFWGEKELSQYGETVVGNGMVNIKTKDGKSFYSTSLSVINAPLLKPILDNLFRAND